MGVFVQDETEAWLVQHSGRLLVRVGVHLSTQKGEQRREGNEEICK